MSLMSRSKMRFIYIFIDDIMNNQIFISCLYMFISFYIHISFFFLASGTWDVARFLPAYVTVLRTWGSAESSLTLGTGHQRLDVFQQQGMSCWGVPATRCFHFFQLIPTKKWSNWSSNKIVVFQTFCAAVVSWNKCELPGRTVQIPKNPAVVCPTFRLAMCVISATLLFRSRSTPSGSSSTAWQTSSPHPGLRQTNRMENRKIKYQIKIYNI